MRKVIGKCVATVLILAGLNACGGAGNEAGDDSRLLAATALSTVAPAAEYATVVQQLYVAYFGRPADPAGLANFQTALSAVGAPTNIQDLIAAYKTSTAVKSLIDSFGTSVESQLLYSGDNTAFITAVFNNILNRPPQTAGLTFWRNALDSGSLSRGNAALSIMAGALNNTSAQGQLDAALVDKKIAIGASFTTSVSIGDYANAYKGASAAATVRAMLATVTGDTDTTAFGTTIDSTLKALANASATLADCFQLTPGVKYQLTNGYIWLIVQEALEGVTAMGRVELRANETRFSAIYETVQDGYVKLLGMQDYDGSGAPDGVYVNSDTAKFSTGMKVGQTTDLSYTVTNTEPNYSTGSTEVRQYEQSGSITFAGVENVTLGGRTFTNVCKLTDPDEGRPGQTYVAWRAKGFGYIRTERQDAQGVTVSGTRKELATILSAT